jgi:hypothetical protein
VSKHILATSIAVANEVQSNLLDTPSLLSQTAPSVREPYKVVRFITIPQSATLTVPFAQGSLI